MSKGQIIAGSAWFKEQDGKTVLNPTIKYCFKLTEKGRPKVCYIGTAKGDDAKSIDGFYDAAKQENIEASHLSIFPIPNHQNLEELLLSQDVIWIDWGSVANLLAVWHLHEIDKVLRKAWDNGVILSGVSAGALCWGVGGTTDSFSKELKPFTNGLGILPYSFGVHYDSEENRRPLYKAISESAGKCAYKVSKNVLGKVEETKIGAELL